MSLRYEDISWWENVGDQWTYISYIICQVEPDIYTMINESISSPHYIVSLYDNT